MKFNAVFFCLNGASIKMQKYLVGCIVILITYNEKSLSISIL